MEKKRYVCEFCDLDTTNYPGFCAHKKSCQTVKDNWNEILLRYTNGEALRNLTKEFKMGFTFIKRIFDKNSIQIRNMSEANKGKKHPHSEESKFKISERRKQYFKENPDKHPWKKSDKFKSVPCENFKKVLTEMGIKFIPEMSVCDNRFFSVDVGIPQHKIAIEINGNQHYERDGSLKDYYKQRHDYITDLGWKVYEFHYSICFDEEVIKKTIENVLEGSELFDFDYEKYLFDKLNKKDKTICQCGSYKNKYSIKCRLCELELRRINSKEKTHSL